MRPTLTLAFSDYRFGYIDYFSVNNDSYTHYLLAGFDYTFEPPAARGGAARAWNSVGISTRWATKPHPIWKATFDLRHRQEIRTVALSTALRHRGRRPDGGQHLKSDTFRVGVDFNQTITPRISAYLGLYYTHSFYNTPVTNNQGSFDENTYDVSVGARYAINRHLSAEIGYTHTTVDSAFEDVRAYDRNRYFAGVRLSF